jgi:hypothetical protein
MSTVPAYNYLKFWNTSGVGSGSGAPCIAHSPDGTSNRQYSHVVIRGYIREYIYVISMGD